MATIATIISDAPQASGRHVTIRWTGDAGDVVENTRWLDTGVDAQVFADSLIPRVEARWRQLELRAAAAATFAGVDPHTLPRTWVTAAEMRVYVLKRIVNLMRQGSGDGNITDLIGAKVVVDLFTNAQIAGQLDGVNAAQVATWRAKLDALVAALVDYDTGFAEQDVTDG